jgi:prepilin-type N-terminal cleavage/methylation domain-containing protein
MPNRASHRASRPSTRSGFSLIELIVVIGLILLLIGILLPVLGAVRTNARVATTQATIADLSTAVGQFQAQNRRLPGVFSGRDMGAPDNADEGFTEMENILLDLAGGVIPLDSTNTGIEVGPLADQESKIQVSVGDIGGPRGPGFFDPGSGVLEAPEQNSARSQFTGQAGTDEHKAMPDIVDAFGIPILAWRRTQLAGNEPDFAAVDSSGDTALFYWNSNAGWLNSGGMGPRENKVNRNASAIAPRYSEAHRVSGMEAIIGNPGFPSQRDQSVPAAARGGIVFHGAGPDGIHAGLVRPERGANRLRYVPAGVNPSEAVPDFDTGVDLTIDNLDDQIIGTGG